VSLPKTQGFEDHYEADDRLSELVADPVEAPGLASVLINPQSNVASGLGALRTTPGPGEILLTRPALFHVLSTIFLGNFEVILKDLILS